MMWLQMIAGGCWGNPVRWFASVELGQENQHRVAANDLF
jgi:hypothetical protein